MATIVYLGPHAEAFEEDTRFPNGEGVEIDDEEKSAKILKLAGFFLADDPRPKPKPKKK